VSTTDDELPPWWKKDTEGDFQVSTTDDLLRAVREFLDSHAELMGHTWPVDSDEYSKWVLRDNAAFWRLYEVHAGLADTEGGPVSDTLRLADVKDETREKPR